MGDFSKDKDLEKALDKYRKGYFPDKLTYEALLLLLQHDHALQQLIRSLCELAPSTDVNAIDKVELETENELEQPTEATSFTSPIDAGSDQPSTGKNADVGAKAAAQLTYEEPLRAELALALRLLELVEQHGRLNAYLLAGCKTEGERIMTLLVKLGRWDQIEMIWDTLADDVKQHQQPATTNDLELLDACLACFNLASSQFKARLDQPKLPQDFNHKLHNRLNAKGKVATAIGLPGLINAAGDTARKVLVITE